MDKRNEVSLDQGESIYSTETLTDEQIAVYVHNPINWFYKK